MENVAYSYRFVQKFYEPRTRSANDFLLYKLLYTFTSPKSHQDYWVWVEVYRHDLYAVKFHLKNHRDSPKKYSIMTGLGEPYSVVRTCVNIMLEIAAMNENASFGFVGAAGNGETHENTRRFRFYCSVMNTYFSETEFVHLINESQSYYVLMRRNALAADPETFEKIKRGMVAMYDYFD